MLKLKLQYFGHLMRRTDSLEKTLMLGNIEGRRRRGQQRMRWLDGITDLMDMSLSKFWGVGDGQGSMACCIPWGHKESDMTEQLNNKMPMYKVCVYYTPRCVYKCVYMYMYVHKHFCICMWICMHV